jgi:hypothetical protein
VAGGGIAVAKLVESEAAEASWIWTAKMHATEGNGKHEDGSIFWWRRQLTVVTKSSPGDGNMNDDVK